MGKYVVDAVTGKAKAKENALQERVTKLEVQLPTEREKGRQEGGKQVLQAILSAAHLKLEDLTPENIGKRWRLWFDKAKSLEQEVKQLKEAAEAQKEAAYWAKINFGNERYREGLKGSQTRIKGLEEDVAELIREYAHGDPDVLRHYSTPREERLFMSPKELEQQEAERKKREQEGKRKHRKSPKLPNKNGKKNRNAHGDSDANAKKSGLHYDSSLFFCFTCRYNVPLRKSQTHSRPLHRFRKQACLSCSLPLNRRFLRTLSMLLDALFPFGDAHAVLR